jgi:hypothetical protein
VDIIREADRISRIATLEVRRARRRSERADRLGAAAPVHDASVSLE